MSPKTGAILRIIAIILVGLTAAFTLLGEAGTTCVAFNADKYGRAFALFVPNLQAPRLNLPIQLILLPTYASWTNPAEKVWRKLKQEELHLHCLADVWEALKQRVAAFLDRFAQGSRELLRYV